MSNLRRATGIDKRDTVNWTDTGCSVSPKCVLCSLPACRYETAGGLSALQRPSRDAEILELRRNGASIAALQSRFGLSKRTIFRIQEKAS